MKITRQDWQTMPWRNGGGVTHEILRDGPAERFSLRVSVAEVAADGPFSTFAGVDRTIVLLDGPGMVLRRDDGVVAAFDRPLVPFPFHGEDRWACTLPGGPVRDFNVMVDRGRLRAQVVPVRVGAERAVLPFDDRLLLFVVDGEVTAGGEALGPSDLLDTTGPLALSGEGATALVVRITPATGPHRAQPGSSPDRS